jgi:HPt (histidine-containing phosphotransfer) domain-containing protein
MVNDEPRTLDLRFIAELRALQDASAPRFVDELIDLFLVHGRERLAELKGCLQARNARGLARAAHTLKGSSGSLGALRLRALCGALEGDLGSEAGAGPETRVGEIELEFERVREALEAARKP